MTWPRLPGRPPRGGRAILSVEECLSIQALDDWRPGKVRLRHPKDVLGHGVGCLQRLPSQAVALEAFKEDRDGSPAGPARSN